MRQLRFEPLEARCLFAGEVVISEIMYHAASQDQRDEFIELTNPGLLPVNLAGWRFESGVEFTFPNVSIGPGQQMVVAAEVARFQTMHPGVASVVGGYSGRLSNSGESVALVNAGGVLIDEVRYADEGDWGVRVVGPLDHGHRGWIWTAEHDGSGKSVELVNRALSNDYGQNWAASLVVGGTPGAANSTQSENIAPLLVDVLNSPTIPRSSDAVTVSARVLDEQATGVIVSLFHRVDGAPAFTESPMFDDGAHGDGVAGDGIYGATLEPQPDGTVVEFYVRAGDGASHVRTYPAAAQPNGEQLTNLLYQVDDAVYSGDQPIYRLIMTEAERAELSDIGSAPFEDSEYNSNAQMNGTFVSVDGSGADARYNVGIRNRGRGSRFSQPNNYRINLPNDRRWQDVAALGLNGQYSGLEVAGSMILRQAGIDAQDGIAASVRVNGSDLAAGADADLRMFGSYSHIETLDSDFAENHYPLDSAGNLYRGFDGLVYRGTNPDAYRAELHGGDGYEKQTNQEADDWQDLIQLTAAFDLDETPDEEFAERIREVINVEQWMRTLAMHELLGNRENSLPTGVADDYSLYRGTGDTRFRLISHDLDTILGLGDDGGGVTLPIFRAARVDALDRLLKHPKFAPLYFQALRELSDTVLAPQNIDPLLDNWLGGYFGAAEIESAKAFLVARREHIFNADEPLVPLALAISSTLPVQNGYRTTTSSSADLVGQANAIRTRSVLVNGQPAVWTAWQANWSADNVPLRPGVNRVLVQALDENGVEFERRYIDIRRDTGLLTTVGGTLPAGETHWTVAGSPYRAISIIEVPAGATLRIDPGVTVFFDAGAGLSITGGRLAAEGTDLARIQLARTPGAAGNWRGLQFVNTAEANRLSFVDQAFGDAGFGGGARNLSAINSRVDIEQATWSGTSARILDFENSSFRVAHSRLPDVGSVEPVHGEGVPSGGYAIFEGNHFGRNSGFNDIIDFSDVQQPGAVLQLLGNVFDGGEDDILDLDGCDAYIEGNIFRSTHLTDPNNPDTSSAISGGEFDGERSEWTIVRNYFYDLDHAVLVKEGAFATIVNNTMVDLRVAAINFDEPGRTGIVPGLGAYLDGNIIWATPQVFENVNSDGTTTNLVVLRSILSGVTVYPGAGNSNLDPHLRRITEITDPVRDLSLQPGFGPARGSGPNGRDMGAAVRAGATIGGVPQSPTYQTSANFTIGGPEIEAYRYRINGGAWSGDVVPASPITLSGLSSGVQTVEVVSRNAAGVWQQENAATVATWTVDGSLRPGLRISEVLAQNTAAVNHEGTFPDMVELVNDGPDPVDLLNMSITDNPRVPRKFVFPTSVILAQGERLVLVADDPDGTSGIHLGFALRAEGEGVFLFDKPVAGGGQLDGVAFGRQLDDISLVRRADGTWGPGRPSLGAANVPLPTGNISNLRINEWLAAHEDPFNNDLIELYNGDSLPVDLGGLYLTDNPMGWPERHPIAPLTFVAGNGVFVFTADGDPEDGPDHVAFQLDAQKGMIGLFGQADAVDGPGEAPNATALVPIDIVIYGPQSTNISQGRTPNGKAKWDLFAQPNFGVDNPVVNSTVETVNLIPLEATGWKFNQTAQFGDGAWTQPEFDDGDPITWPHGQAPFARDNDTWPAGVPKNTTLTATRTTFYFRKRFEVTDFDRVTNLLLKLAVDDGAVVYLNGHEVLRHQMPQAPATIQYSTRSTRSPTSWDTQIEGPFAIDEQWLVAGENVLAIEVHQASGSNDMGFGAVLDLQRSLSPGEPPALRIVELNYHPYDLTAAELAVNPDWTADDFEFIEIFNAGEAAVNLAGVQIAQAVNFTFASTALPAGGRAIVVKNPAAFAARYGGGVNVVGAYSGTLSDTSESIAIFDVAGQSIQKFVYGDSGDWPGRADGAGSTLLLADESGNPTIAGNWRASTAYGGSPGLEDRAVLPIRINEVLTHTDDPLTDAIELFNASGAAVDISGWYLSDSSGALSKFRIPDGTVLAAGAYAVFDEDDFNPTPGAGASFALDSAVGDDVWLTQADPDTGKLLAFVDHVEFPAAANGESFGRWINGAGGLYPMRSRTLGGENSGPRIGPVVINEIMYHPSGNNSDLEYVELVNISQSPVELFEAGRGGWKFDKGIDFTFAPGTVIAAGGALLVVRFDPSDPANTARLATFRDVYDLADTAPIVGGYAGALHDVEIDNSGDDLRLARPDAPQPGGLVPYLLVDEVDFSDAAPWPTSADGDGAALARESTAIYGQEPSNWTGAVPTPGTANTPPQPATVSGTGDDDSILVVRSGSQLHVYLNGTPGGGPPTHSFELASLGGTLVIEALGGDDLLVVDCGEQPTLGIERLIYHAAAGTNELVLSKGSAWIDSTTDAGGTLDTTVQSLAHFSTSRLQQNRLTLEPDSVATLLPDGGTSALANLSLSAEATLDITNNALVLDYSGNSPSSAIREWIISGRGGAGVGLGTWNGKGITSSAAAQDNTTAPESRSVAYAENGALPLGPYTAFRGQAVDATSILIAYARTADANLDGLVNDDDVTVLGATYAPGVSNPHWALGDFDYSGFISDDDVTLLGAFYEPAVAAPPPESADENRLASFAAESASSMNYTGASGDVRHSNAFQLFPSANRNDVSPMHQAVDLLDAACVDYLLSAHDEAIFTRKVKRLAASQWMGLTPN